MNVYIVTEFVPFEGESVLGVFARRPAAEVFSADRNDEERAQYPGSDLSFPVTEWAVRP